MSAEPKKVRAALPKQVDFVLKDVKIPFRSWLTIMVNLFGAIALAMFLWLVAIGALLAIFRII